MSHNPSSQRNNVYMHTVHILSPARPLYMEPAEPRVTQSPPSQHNNV